MEWSQSEKLSLSDDIRHILSTLSHQDVYDTLDLSTVDGVVLEQGGKVILCFRNMGVKGDEKRTLTIDVDEVDDLTQLVQRAEARVSRTWWKRTSIILGILGMIGFVKHLRS